MSSSWLTCLCSRPKHRRCASLLVARPLYRQPDPHRRRCQAKTVSPERPALRLPVEYRRRANPHRHTAERRHGSRRREHWAGLKAFQAQLLEQASRRKHRQQQALPATHCSLGEDGAATAAGHSTARGIDKEQVKTQRRRSAELSPVLCAQRGSRY